MVWVIEIAFRWSHTSLRKSAYEILLQNISIASEPLKAGRAIYVDNLAYLPLLKHTSKMYCLVKPRERKREIREVL